MAVTWTDKGLDAALARLKELRNLGLHVGTFEPKVMTYALIVEHERPFLRNVAFEQRAAIGRALTDAVKLIIKGADTVGRLSSAGKFLAGAVRRKIETASAWAKPLAASTIRRKGHARPLVDSRDLVDSIGWQVHKDGAIVAEGK